MADVIGEPALPPRRVLAALAVVVFALLLGRNMTRELDSDEQHYVAPPVLLREEGLLPYEDYPYFHMPTQVFLYAYLTGWSPYKLLAARVISTLCGTGTVLLIFLTGWRWLAGLTTRERWLCAGGLTLIFSCSRFFTYTSGLAWNHDTSMLCALGALLLYLRGVRVGSLLCFAAAGFLLGGAIGIRLSFALCFLPFTLALWLAPSALSGRRRLAAVVLAGLAALTALAPAILLMLRAPERFFFCNLRYPRLYTISDNIHDSALHALVVKVGKSLFRFGTDPGNLFLLCCFVAALVWLARHQRLVWRSHAVLILAGLLLALTVGVLGPTPQQYQYNYVLLPFMILLLFQVLAMQTEAGQSIQRWKQAVAFGALVIGAIGLPRWYWGVVQLPFPERWATVQEHRLGEWLRAHCRPEARVLTVAPIAPLEGGLKIYPEHAVGYFVLKIASFQTLEDRQRVGTVAAEDLARVLGERPPDVVFTPPGSVLDIPFLRYAEEHGFQRIEVPGGEHQMLVKPETSNVAHKDDI